ncbi:MAG: RNase adapter RapZ [Bacillota bacterium]|nr:RNase adapter RapZ [Bacillota bacterium]MDW7682920.1 RNase adapter RapZ [Bacillota bacterium]
MENIRFVIITGLSGAGKSQAIRSFEDLGYFCIDNLPPMLIPKFAELAAQSQGKINRIALVSDIRGGDFFTSLLEALEMLEGVGFDYEILFLEADDDVLIRRFKETRRRHPLASQGSILEGLKEEKRLLADIRSKADKIINTSALAPQQLKEEITSLYAPDSEQENILITLVAFGFKYGIPLDADLVFDVRFLPNPHYVEHLRPLTGNNQEVKDYVWKWTVTHKFFQKLIDLIQFLVPCYIKEGKPQLVVAIGCTGGKHRSVSIVNELEKMLNGKNYRVIKEYRDIQKA